MASLRLTLEGTLDGEEAARPKLRQHLAGGNESTA